jgi:hypothetical protein
MDDQGIREQLLATFARRIDDSDAMDKLIAVAKEDPTPHLQQRAIFWLAQSKDERAAKAVAEIVAP